MPRIWLGVIFLAFSDVSAVLSLRLGILLGGGGGLGIGGFSGWLCMVLIPLKIEQFTWELPTDSMNVAAV